jgi:hypothetical protein
MTTLVATFLLLFIGKISAPWIREHVTPHIRAEVQRELSINDALQCLRCPWVTRAVDFSAANLSIGLYVCLVPALGWAGYPEVARFAVYTLASTAYLCAYCKVRAICLEAA